MAQREASGSVRDESACPERVEKSPAEAGGFNVFAGYDFPSEWSMATLESLAASVTGGGTPSTKEPAYWDGDIPWTTSAAIDEEGIFLKTHQRCITRKGLEDSSTQLIPKGSVLIGTRVGVGKAAVTTYDIAISQDLTALVPRPQVNAEFVALALKSRQLAAWFEENKRGTTIKGVSRNDVMRLMIPLPPLTEQRAIAEVLRTVQRAKEATENVIAATHQLKASLLKHLFTYGPVPIDQAAYMPLKETAIGAVPAAWSVARVGELGEVVTGTTPSTKRPDFYGGPHMFITPGDMGADKFITQTEKWLTDLGLAECRALPKNAVAVVCIGATIGKTGLTGADNCATNQQCNSVIAGEQVDPEFLFYALSDRASALPPLASRAAVPIVNKSNFCEFQVALPSLSEQREIAAQLAAVDAKLAVEEKRRAALDVLFKSLLHHLMTGRLRVKDIEVQHEA